MTQENIISETIQKEIVCKGCSGKLQFAPGTNHLKCPACGTENDIEISTQVFEELDFEQFLNNFEKEAAVQEIVATDVAPRQHSIQTLYRILVHAVVLL
jgi:LSD1 subclass zinc finger protein